MPFIFLFKPLISKKITKFNFDELHRPLQYIFVISFFMAQKGIFFIFTFQPIILSFIVFF
jgi:hypothetical protein